jgi:Ca2+-binding RTX toxin-like protein
MSSKPVPLDEADLALVSGGSITSKISDDVLDGVESNGGIDKEYAGGDEEQAGDDGVPDPPPPPPPVLIGGTGGTDLLLGTAGNDIISAHGGNDAVYASTGNDIVDAGAGNDIVYWVLGAGNDPLSGGAGQDTLALRLTTERQDPAARNDMLAQLLTMIDSLGGTPRMGNGYIDVTGVVGTITIGNERITFGSFERLVLQ